MAGRPPMLSPDTLGKLVAAIRAGATVSGAAEAAGISRRTFHRWMARGKAARRGQFRELWEAITKALAESEIAHVAAICNAARAGDWRASAWLLERRFPRKYGKRTHHLVAGDPEAPAVFTLELPQLSPTDRGE